MSNPLAIVEIIRNVATYLDVKELAVVWQLNKTWRLEAQRKLYQNRNTIIYGFFEPYLNDLRLRHLDPENSIVSVIPFHEFNRFNIFRQVLGLDVKIELLSIRDQFRAEFKRLKKICKSLNRKARKKEELIRTFTSCSLENYRARFRYGAVVKEARISERRRFEHYRNLVNFEYFLVRFGSTRVLTDEEIDTILDKLQDLWNGEEEISWFNSASDFWEDY